MRWSTLVDTLFPPVCVECDVQGAALCARCFPPAWPVRFTIADVPCVALGAYEGALRRAVLALKSGRRDVAEALGERMGGLVAACAVDALVPIPTTAARRRQRGFDQGELLASVAARRAGLPVRVVLRRVPGQAQQGRSRSQRLEAVGRFAYWGASLSNHARVLLVDDVVTTGATFRDCTGVLRGIGLRIAGGLVVARASNP